MVKESDQLQLIQTIRISRITDGPSISHASTTKSKTRHNHSLGIQTSTSTSPDNFHCQATLDEVPYLLEQTSQGPHVRQIERLKLTPTGCYLLQPLGYQHPDIRSHRSRLLLFPSSCKIVAPIPTTCALLKTQAADKPASLP